MYIYSETLQPYRKYFSLEDFDTFIPVLPNLKYFISENRIYNFITNIFHKSDYLFKKKIK